VSHLTERPEEPRPEDPGRDRPGPGEEDGSDAADGYNAGYADRLHEKRLRESGAVPPALADWLENGGAHALVAPADATRPAHAKAHDPGPAQAADPVLLKAAGIAGELVGAIREQGHLDVPLDPLGAPAPGHPTLRPEFYGISEEQLSRVPAQALDLERLGETARDVLARLREIYCQRIGYEIDQLEDPAQREWLIDYIENGRHWEPLAAQELQGLASRLTQVEGIERFLHRSYLGKKRFSIEGLDMLVPMLDELLERAARWGSRETFIGMAHRGRLNVLAHIVGRPYAAVIGEFEGHHSIGIQTTVPEDGSGDVKYHYGAYGVYETSSGPINVLLAPNPSHLEHVNPIVEGMARASRELRFGTRRDTRTRDTFAADRLQVLPILIHGDAAFMGQGVVAETLNLSRLAGYETGGTVHLIANNQLGFTTRPSDTRSTRYASDLALGFRLPVLHVNADDPEACLAAIRLAADYRGHFGEDIVVDLVGYRRYGHNEGDEPGYTQPELYRRIAEHQTVRAIWIDRLISEGSLTDEAAAGMADRVATELETARERVLAASDAETAVEDRGPPPEPVADGGSEDPARPWRPASLWAELTEDDRSQTDTQVTAERLVRLNERLHSWPEDFELFQKLDRQLARRSASLDTGIDWAHAESLAFATLLTGGIPIRFTGEDSERGTFSHRHLVFHDANGSGTYVPLQHLASDQAPFQVWNSPLSEVAVLGFEYGYSTIAADSLVLWEAQFGDFVNVAQAIIDQFIAAGRSKWGQESRLVLLLPHGNEGQGPEHSSARPERFLQLGAERNIRVANPTTPAQYFHLLRLQALRLARRPLIAMTPKSLLRHPRARSSLDDLAAGYFRPVLIPEIDPPEAVRRVVLCTGKVYYDLVLSEAFEEAADRVAVVRVEQLYPLPEMELRAAIEGFPRAREIVWAQEEPRNMGAWDHIRFALDAAAAERSVLYVGRDAKASTAEGYSEVHAEQQARLVREALTVEE
jgi:2-oxoglutarate dehydrogenase E1 component